MKENGVLLIGIFFLVAVCVSDDSYKVYNIESDKVCAYNKHVINRINAGFNGIIVRETSYFNELSGKYSFSCKFEVKTGAEDQFPGLFVVIQNLHMRRNETTGECIDYVMLGQVKKGFIRENFNLNLNIKDKSTPLVKFCGDLRAKREGNLAGELSKELAVTGFVSDYHTIEVEIFIDKIPNIDESIELEILFTPFLICKNSWSQYRECGMEKCIKKRSFKDGWVNCPFLNCPDEEGCSNSTTVEDRRQRELQITLTAVTSIFCSFFLFLLVIWCCRYFELLCWGATTLLRNSNPLELSPMNQRAPSPTAPASDSTTKDLPPAYETLFPDR